MKLISYRVSLFSVVLMSWVLLIQVPSAHAFSCIAGDVSVLSILDGFDVTAHCDSDVSYHNGIYNLVEYTDSGYNPRPLVDLNYVTAVGLFPFANRINHYVTSAGIAHYFTTSNATTFTGLPNKEVNIKSEGYQSPGMVAEDAIIDKIDKEKKITISVGTSTDPQFFQFDLNDVTNCPRIAGPDPDEYAKSHGGKQPIKVVFMRGKSWDSSVGQFVGRANSAIQDGFYKVDPFKKYAGNFSFYIDLKKHDEASLSVDAETHMYLPSSVGYLKANSSCFGTIGYADEYIFDFAREGIYPAWAYTMSPFNFSNSGMIFNNNEENIAHYWYTIMHETGHIFGLWDEYVQTDTPSEFWFNWYGSPMNCSSNPQKDFRSSKDNRMYASGGYEGCMYLKSKFLGTRYYSPSGDNIMLSSLVSYKFNVISCGYIVAAIKGESSTKENAQKYWPECLGLDTVKDGIPPVSPTPTISNAERVSRTSSQRSFLAQVAELFSRLTVGQGFGVSITGTGFTSTGNAAQFINVDTQASYEVLDIPSGDGRTLVVTVPTTTPAGNYMLKVGAFNSEWSNDIPVTITTSDLPVISLSVRNETIQKGDSINITWSADGATSCTGSGSSDAQTLVLWNSIYGPSGSVLLTPTADYSELAISCSGHGGTSGLGIDIHTTGFASPEISFEKIGSSVIYAGQDVTVTWDTSKALTCRGDGYSDSMTMALWNKNQPLSGSSTFKALQNTTLILTCTGYGGIETTSELSIPVQTPILAGTCSVLPTQAGSYAINQLVTFTIQPTGGYGAGSYTYSWSGSDGMIGNTKSISKIYTTQGAKSASVTVNSYATSTVVKCPNISLSSFAKPPMIGGVPTTYKSTPSIGIPGTEITIYGTRNSLPINGATWVTVEKGGQKIYLRPKSIKKGVNAYDLDELTFIFDPSAPLPAPNPGDVYTYRLESLVGIPEYPQYAQILKSNPVFSIVMSTTTSLYPATTTVAVVLVARSATSVVVQGVDQAYDKVESGVPLSASSTLVSVKPKSSSFLSRTPITIKPKNIVAVNSYDFGGMYAKTSGRTYANPATGGLSCPKEYNQVKLVGTADYTLTACLKKHEKGNPLYDFGGIYGTISQIRKGNTLSSDGYCPSGFIVSQIGDKPDQGGNALNFCYRQHKDNPPYQLGSMNQGVTSSCASSYRKVSFGSGKLSFMFCYRDTPTVSTYIDSAYSFANVFEVFDKFLYRYWE